MNHTRARIPGATYRLQFNGTFRFTDAREIVSYLHELGITDIYASPYFKARIGSCHGYDILDQNMLNPEIGSDDEHTALCRELARHGMGQILDIVPNHMSVEGENLFWLDLLENGPSSPYARFFDIDWHPVKKELENKILIPILGDQYGTVLENGELRLRFSEGAFQICYYDHVLPVIPKTYSNILTWQLERLEQSLSSNAPEFNELMSIITALKHLPAPTETDLELITERYREKEVVKRRLWDLYNSQADIRQFIDDNATYFNGIRGKAESFDLLDSLLCEQVYRISHWRVATEEINYRRFFDINSLGAIRIEDAEVFDITHQLIFRLVKEGKVTGLRVDHADGLRDPSAYFRKLQLCCFKAMHHDLLNQEASASKQSRDEPAVTPLQVMYERMLETDPTYKPFYIIGEKILGKGETVPGDWPVFGATGYSFVNQVNGLLVDTDNARSFDKIYARVVSGRMDFQQVVYEKKKLVMQVAMSSEINMLAHRLNAISETNRHTRDFTLNSLTRAIVEVIACFPVYRTYINSFAVSDRDTHYVETAIKRALRRNPAISRSVFEFVRNLLLLQFPQNSTGTDRAACLDFVMRFQQLSGPVMAKGCEDTACYLYNRLVSLNEVGGSPEQFGLSLEAFHGQNMHRSKTRPLAMLATSTHDTKRSEDVRARINVLSEMPDRWREAVARWSRFNRNRKALIEDQAVPDRNEEYQLYQTLIGTWPFCGAVGGEYEDFCQRIKAYMLKAMREAKTHTSWVNPDGSYEDAVLHFIDALLTPGGHNTFLPDFALFQKATAFFGMLNALSQTVLKMTSPGVPDFYQGSELWDFSLVDPDNRRPVDFSLRRAFLQEMREREAAIDSPALVHELLESWPDGKIKQFLIWKTLAYRQKYRELFESGSYLPLTVDGPAKEHICAFERSSSNARCLVVVPLYCCKLMQGNCLLPVGEGVWNNTVIVVSSNGTDRFRNLFTGEPHFCGKHGEKRALSVARVLAGLPVAVLVSEAQNAA